MSSKIIYERIFWFHNRIKDDRFPNTRALSEQFGVSRKTAQRDIEFMRDRLGFPLRYVPDSRGYAYEDNTWELPGLWLNEDELVSLVLSYRLASAVPDASVKTALRTFLNDVIARHACADFNIDEISEKISVKNIAYGRPRESVFHRMLEALLRSRPLRIEYYSPHNNRSSVRDILPLHLLNYMGTWHIIAHCHVKKELRDFVLSRVKSVTASTASIAVPASAKRVKAFIRRTFGIFRGRDTSEVCLSFAGDIAPWIAEQNWHPAQQMTVGKDGRLCLTVPVADFREIKREILRYGSKVEVLSPAALREEIKKEIGMMKTIYT